jgi:TPR repeat protein
LPSSISIPPCLQLIVHWHGSIPERRELHPDELEGSLVQKDDALAATFFRRAAELGDALGISLYGGCLMTGEGVRRDFVAARQCYKTCADMGNAHCQEMYARFAEFGRGGPHARKDALKYYGLVAAQKQPAAMVKHAETLLYGWADFVDEEKAVQMLVEAAALGEGRAAFLAAQCFAEGVGGNENRTMAVLLFRQAADLGDVSAHYLYGQAVVRGDGVAKNVTEALLYLERAVEDDGFAMLAIGKLLLDPHNEERDPPKGIEWLRRAAAEKGMTEAHYRLGLCERDAMLVSQNQTRAFEYFRLAAQHGHPGKTSLWKAQ